MHVTSERPDFAIYKSAHISVKDAERKIKKFLKEDTGALALLAPHTALQINAVRKQIKAFAAQILEAEATDDDERGGVREQ